MSPRCCRRTPNPTPTPTRTLTLTLILTLTPTLDPHPNPNLLQALALSRVLCRTLLLPGFFVRSGDRSRMDSVYREEWLPTAHFLDLR